GLMTDIADTYTEVLVSPDQLAQADAMNPIYVRELLGKKFYTFESVPKAQLEPLGELHTPSVADLFVAKMKEDRHG
ncbi:MAG: ABC transporter ATP-binding protein, partial [Proteobacteria bacterium]|nr:ABC transporter ATP-binding protein [Pseudomonadota bacterium]